jgi:hypothetical protein
MINHLKPINSNFALGLKMCKKYSKNEIMLHDVQKHLHQYGKVKTDG